MFGRKKKVQPELPTSPPAVEVLPGHEVRRTEPDAHGDEFWLLVCHGIPTALFMTKELPDFLAVTPHVYLTSLRRFGLVMPSLVAAARYAELLTAERDAQITAEADRAAKHFENLGGGDAS